MSRENTPCATAPRAVAQCDALALGLMRGWLLALAWPRVVDVMVCNWWRIGRGL